MSKGEVEKFLEDKGNYVKVDHLERFLETGVRLDMKKFVLAKLSLLYSDMKMYNDAAKKIANLAELETTFREKQKSYIKAVEYYVKGGFFDDAERAFKKALACGNATEKAEMKVVLKQFYKKQGESYEKSQHRNQAMKVYERLLQLDLNEQERREIKERLLELYSKLGKIHDFMSLKHSMKSRKEKKQENK